MQETWDAEELTEHKPPEPEGSGESTVKPKGTPFPQRPCSACLGWHQPAMGHILGSGSQSTELGEKGGFGAERW